MKKLFTLFLLFFSLQSFSQSDCDTQNTREKILTKIGYAPTTNSIQEISKFCHYEDWIISQLDNPKYFNDNSIIKNLNNFKVLEEDQILLLNNIYSLTQNYSNKNNVYEDLAKDIFKKRIIYSLYSQNRIREMMVWFWFNHFSVYGANDVLRSVNQYENIFRNNPFGNFKDILWEVMHHPAMLVYLDGDRNFKPSSFKKDGFTLYLGYNENYAREFLELHTMGINSGYTQKDIEELTKILTGFNLPNFANLNDSNVINNYSDYLKYIKEYQPEATVVYDNFSLFQKNHHDNVDKIFLGTKILADNENEIKKVIDIVSSRPETAKFISNKIALFFLGKKPNIITSQALINSFQNSNGNIAQVLKTLFNSKEFKDSLDTNLSFKNPYEYYISTTKLTLNDKFIDNFDTLYFHLRTLGFHPYFKYTPEGYSLKGEDYYSANFLHQYINFSKYIESPLCFNTEINLNNNYYKMNRNEYLNFLISPQWLYK